MELNIIIKGFVVPVKLKCLFEVRLYLKWVMKGWFRLRKRQKIIF